MGERKVKHIQFIFDDGEYETLTAHDEQRKYELTELHEIIMREDLDGFAVCFVDKYGGCGGMVTNQRAREKALEIFKGGIRR